MRLAVALVALLALLTAAPTASADLWVGVHVCSEAVIQGCIASCDLLQQVVFTLRCYGGCQMIGGLWNFPPHCYIVVLPA